MEFSELLRLVRLVRRLDKTIVPHTDIRRLTSIGALRAYIVSHLRSDPKIHQGQTLIVCQRDPGPCGLPLEVCGCSGPSSG